MNAQLMDQARAATVPEIFPPPPSYSASARLLTRSAARADHLRSNSLMGSAFSRMPPKPIPPLCAMLRMESPALC